MSFENQKSPTLTEVTRYSLISSESWIAIKKLVNIYSKIHKELREYIISDLINNLISMQNCIILFWVFNLLLNYQLVKNLSELRVLIL